MTPCPGAVANDVRGPTYLNNRYYDPSIAAFVTVDPLVGKTGQAYLYGNGSPATLSDPSGLDPGWAHDNDLCNDPGGRQRCQHDEAKKELADKIRGYPIFYGDPINQDYCLIYFQDCIDQLSGNYFDGNPAGELQTSAVIALIIRALADGNIVRCDGGYCDANGANLHMAWTLDGSGDPRVTMMSPVSEGPEMSGWDSASMIIDGLAFTAALTAMAACPETEGAGCALAVGIAQIAGGAAMGKDFAATLWSCGNSHSSCAGWLGTLVTDSLFLGGKSFIPKLGFSAATAEVVSKAWDMAGSGLSAGGSYVEYSSAKVGDEKSGYISVHWVCSATV